VARLEGLLAQKGRGVEEIEVAVPFLTMVSEKEGTAARRAELYMERGNFDRTLRFFADTLKYGLVGTPEQCTERIRQYLQLGVTQVIFDVRPPSNALSTLELLCDSVIPQFT